MRALSMQANNLQLMAAARKNRARLGKLDRKSKLAQVVRSGRKNKLARVAKVHQSIQMLARSRLPAPKPRAQAARALPMLVR